MDDQKDDPEWRKNIGEKILEVARPDYDTLTPTKKAPCLLCANVEPLGTTATCSQLQQEDQGRYWTNVECPRCGLYLIDEGAFLEPLDAKVGAIASHKAQAACAAGDPHWFQAGDLDELTREAQEKANGA